MVFFPISLTWWCLPFGSWVDRYQQLQKLWLQEHDVFEDFINTVSHVPDILDVPHVELV